MTYVTSYQVVEMHKPGKKPVPGRVQTGSGSGDVIKNRVLKYPGRVLPGSDKENIDPLYPGPGRVQTGSLKTGSYFFFPHFFIPYNYIKHF